MSHWRALHAAGDLQFAPLPPAPQATHSAWLEQLIAVIARVLAPLAQGLGAAWPFVKWGAVVLLVALIAFGLWKLAPRLLALRRGAQPDAIPQSWVPDAAEAEALLEDADALAAAGRYDEAAHLLLTRSVAQIAAARPGALAPAATAREIAALPMLPALARAAFAEIARAVEASRYALRRLGAAEWQVARAAYARFALQSLDARAA